MLPVQRLALERCSSDHDADHQMACGTWATGVAVQVAWTSISLHLTPANCNWRCNGGKYIFSGDFDAICPLTATRYSITDLELSVMEPWRPWTATKEVNNTPNPVLDFFLSFFYSNFDKLVWIRRLEAMFSSTREALCLFQWGELVIKFHISSLREH